MPERNLAKVAFVDEEDELRHAGRCQHHQHIAGHNDAALLDAAADEDAVTRCNNAGIGEARLRRRQPGLRLCKFGLAGDIVTAARTGGPDLYGGDPRVVARHVEVFLRIVEEGPGFEALCDQRRRAALDLRRAKPAGERRLLCIARARQGQFT